MCCVSLMRFSRMIFQAVSLPKSGRQGRRPVIEPDREEAIRRAVFGCGGPTVVLVAGKGSEDYQLRRGVHVPYPTDSVVVERILKEYDAAQA